MSSSCFDAHGNRVKTDILVAGYVRDGTGNVTVDIPVDIIQICFTFWFIDICDQWDKSLCNEHVMIDRDTLPSDDGQYTDSSYDHRWGFGTEVIEHGTFKWRFRSDANMRYINVGVIPDISELIKDLNIESKSKEASDKGLFYILNENGDVYHHCNNKYCVSLSDQDTMIIMSLDMHQRTMSFVIDDHDYGWAYRKLAEKKYRLCVRFGSAKQEIELL